MALIRPIASIQSMSGKLKSDSDVILVTMQRTNKMYSRKPGKRDKEKHPVREGEITTHTKMQEATAAYHAMKQDIEQFGKFKEQYEEEVKKGCTKDLYRYFLHVWLNEGKNSVVNKIARSGCSEETYVKGMQQCQTIDEADRLLVDFIETLGYKKMAEAYKEIRKNERLNS